MLLSFNKLLILKNPIAMAHSYLEGAQENLKPLRCDHLKKNTENQTVAISGGNSLRQAYLSCYLCDWS